MLAERKAASKEADLSAGLGKPDGEIGWNDFDDRYVREHLSGLSKANRKAWLTVSNHVERILRPEYVYQVTAESLSRMVQPCGQRKCEKRRSLVTLANFAPHWLGRPKSN